MILVPLQGDSLSEVCGDLPDGFYGLPRFELPEWVWERLPRTDPQRALAEVERLGPALHLDEPTLSDKWVRFDAPGDFQLVLREDFFAIDGFDEEMLLGWHVDSNLSRRMRLHRGSIETLEGSVAGYHCNHSRIPTVYHGSARISNDLDRFYYSVESAATPSATCDVGTRRRRARGGAAPTANRPGVRRRAACHAPDRERSSPVVRRRQGKLRDVVRLRSRPTVHRRLARRLAAHDHRLPRDQPDPPTDARASSSKNWSSAAT